MSDEAFRGIISSYISFLLTVLNSLILLLSHSYYSTKMRGSINIMKHGRVDNDGCSGSHPLLRPVALFLDGMSRAAILSFGPSLVYRLTFGTKTGKLGSNCSIVAYPLAIVVAAFFLGRFLGYSIGLKFSISPKELPRRVARLSGAAIALHVFTFGAGLTSWWWLVIIRFVSACLVGCLCCITRATNLEEDKNYSSIEILESGMQTSRKTKRRDGYVDIASGTTKIYMTSFAVSILSGGLLYRHATGDATFKALTNSHRFTLSPLFLVAVSITAESVLRCVFSLTNGRPVEMDVSNTGKDSLQQQERSASKLPIAETDIRQQTSCRERADSLKFYTPGKVKQSPSGVNVNNASQSRIGHNEDLTNIKSRDRSESLTSEKFIQCRERSNTTDSDFFDCNSVISDMDDFPEVDIHGSLDTDASNQVARYQDRKCVFADGSPAYVPQGDSPNSVPENYLKFCGGRKDKAMQMWKTTQQWRHEHDIWRIHTRPNVWFSKIKQAYPHFVHGYSKLGHPVIYEQPGKMNLKELFQNGCEVSDMLRHYAFFLEFISNHVCTKAEVRAKLGPSAPSHSSSTWGILVVLDVHGAGISHLSGDVLTYLKNAGEINSAHYPLSMKRAFLVNSPFWLAGVWSTVKGILPDSVQVDILSSSKMGAALREYIDDDQIPAEYGGGSQYSLGEHPFEVELKNLVKEAEKAADESFAYESTTLYPTASSGYSTNNCPVDVDAVPIRASSWNEQPVQPLRRRGASVDQDRSILPFALSEDDYDADDQKKAGRSGGETEIFIVLSVMYFCWSAIQGVIETAIPFWILTPTLLGGLGYAPSRSGVAMFCSTMVLLWVMRTKVSRVISEIPSKAPMRAFRIGAGAQSVLLLLLATVPKSVG